MPVSAVCENLEAGATIEEIIEQFDLTREQIKTVLEFAARSLDPPPAPAAKSFVDAHSLRSCNPQLVAQTCLFCRSAALAMRPPEKPQTTESTRPALHASR